jgi:hypothetical protein
MLREPERSHLVVSIVVGAMRRWAAVGTRGAALAAALVALAAPGSASAAITTVFAGHTVNSLGVPCTAQSDGVRVCQGSDGGSPAADTRLTSFDGVPLAGYVILPPAPASGTDGNYPLIVQSHGWGGQAGGPSSTEYTGPTGDAWAKQGYAVLELTARGWADSCGSAQSRLVDPTGCMKGYIRLDDNRYEVRDIQTASGLLVDEGVVDPNRIGATGPSYGGGVSLQLATLKDRIENTDGTFSPWRSPHGTPLHLAAAAPVIPWSDLVYSLLPNGRTLDFQVTSPTADLSPTGIDKQSFVSGLYALGLASGFYAPPGTDSSADLTTWNTLINAGEPYDSNPQDQAITTQIFHFHSGVLPARRGRRRLGRGAVPTAHLQRLHRRPVPGRRGSALLQPRALAVPRRSDRPLRHGLRAHARTEQARRRGRALGAH